MRIIGVIVVALGLGVAAPAAVWAAGWGGIEPGVTVGQAGVEAEHNRLLMGKDGLRRVVVNSRGVEVAEAERVVQVAQARAEPSVV